MPRSVAQPRIQISRTVHVAFLPPSSREGRVGVARVHHYAALQGVGDGLAMVGSHFSHCQLRNGPLPVGHDKDEPFLAACDLPATAGPPFCSCSAPTPPNLLRWTGRMVQRVRFPGTSRPYQATPDALCYLCRTMLVKSSPWWQQCQWYDRCAPPGELVRLNQGCVNLHVKRRQLAGPGLE